MKCHQNLLSTLRTDDDYMGQTAYHEAAHAVALMVFAADLGYRGNVILGAKLDTDGAGELIDYRGLLRKDCRALITVSDGWISEFNVWLDTKEDRRRACKFVEAHIVALLAGPTAELVLTDAPYKIVYETNPRGCEDDLIQARQYARARRSFGVRYKSWRALYEVALPLVLEHWSTIEALAALLLERGELDGRAVEEFINSRLDPADELLVA